MSDQPYTIVIEGGTGSVSERKLSKHAAGSLLNSSLTVVSNAVAANIRTVVLNRPLKGLTRDHFTFESTQLMIPFIAAVGTSPKFGPHNAAPHGAANLHLWPADAVCVCNIPAAPFGLGKGTIEYTPTGEVAGFPVGRCDEQPRGDLIAQRNPTCDVRTYAGGLNASHLGL